MYFAGLKLLLSSILWEDGREKKGALGITCFTSKTGFIVIRLNVFYAKENDSYIEYRVKETFCWKFNNDTFEPADYYTECLKIDKPEDVKLLVGVIKNIPEKREDDKNRKDWMSIVAFGEHL